MAEVNAGHLELLFIDVFPDVHLGPVGEREDAHVFARIDLGVVKIPDLGPLVFRIPLAEAVAEAEETFLGAGLFLVAPRAADGAVELEFLDGGEEDGDLKLVAADLTGDRLRDALFEGFVHRADDELGAKLLGAAVAELDEFWKFVAGLDVEERHGNVRGAKGFFREAQEADGILAAGKEQGGALELGGDLAHDMDRLGFEMLQMIKMVATHLTREF